ncbi:aminopeptidase P family protein [Campylobacter hepaticus]|uniref:Aminopeptidase P family protein n=1 Tax=Campylobacter hepaticus TaxID=1813019 RepID=A0A424Z1H5_9BACT|nr:aminopeptidase P family protein [Campylobacter hepaticus]AXP08746.1 aminopeptidase P family protein [Campylobacter hepaticus]MCZ0772596.1 aminopeptidase P family protein [Campylobacter hepaticus]MCZ0774064.1 aminopeptidase P family protein [Campylobacter hepaticus]MCZ0775316.1 aminopeptidase P family protein [Campylobacter hepaticus]MDX2323028.1 aminopeptidase P family protein [Campylobacter hepaticus]
MNIYKTRVEQIRQLMIKEKIDAYLILSADPHLSEYLPEFYQSRVFVSGFKGSVGTLLITHKEAFLWVDGRYWLQAEKELKNTSIMLQKQDTNNTFTKWLKENLNEDQNLGVDFAVLPLSLQKELQKHCKAKLKHKDFITPIWENRPILPKNKIYEHELEYCSYTRKEKLSLVREKMAQLQAKNHLISSLDDIAWITNLRGSDVNYNPVFLSHLLILENQALLFVDKEKIDFELEKKLNSDGIWLKDYKEIENELKQLQNTSLLIEPLKMTALLISFLNKNVTILEEINPSTHLKATKTNKEIAHIQNAMIEDGVALCKFFAWLEESIENNIQISELDIDTKVTQLRSQSPYYISNSFATIAGFNGNGAFPHYRAEKENFSYIQKDGLLLIDSGGQYKNGTTDITRVVPIGKINEEQIHDYTLVLKAHIAMSSTIFPKDICMPLLDSITRVPLWQEQLDYAHGTGHGVGYFLNVHEGPQVLSYLSPVLEKTKAKEGMLSSIEPGIYKVGKWGIRLENLVVNTKIDKPKNKDFGEFLYFKTLTLCPFELSCIDQNILDEKEKSWINNYHQEVYEKLSPKLHNEPKALKWLEERTRMI